MTNKRVYSTAICIRETFSDPKEILSKKFFDLLIEARNLIERNQELI